LSPRVLARALGLARVGVGAGVWIAPRGAMRVLGFDAGNAETMALGRLAGTRDVALGLLAAATASDPARGAAVARLNAAVDAADAIAFGGAVARREDIDRAGVVGAASAAAATVFGLWLAARLESNP
jgi:hypothetical protein